MSKVVTIERFILENQPAYARGELTNLLYDIALAAKIVQKETNRAGLVDILGEAGGVNIQGERQQKLDVYADDVLRRICDHTGRLAAMASEEREEIIRIPARHEKGNYLLVYDPLDGSSNIDVNVSIGTVFGIYRSQGGKIWGELEDFLQPPQDLVAAGYVLYGASTMLVYSTGQGVHGFTMDPSLGEFLLSNENMRFPDPPSYYSINQAYFQRWPAAIQEFVRWLQDANSTDKQPLSLRYIGSLVADFHRNLLKGGIFCYPGELDKPEGKIRLMYEAGPLAFLAEQAGGYASNGRQPILEIVPQDLHQRVPFFVGNRSLVERAEQNLQGAQVESNVLAARRT